MPDAFDDLQQAIDAAEQAAAAGNLAQAEVHLHEVLRLQIHYVGELDPDVAATIHKLAIVNERTGRIAEAEAMYRRAVAVASAVLPASDPLVRQCSEDLTAFLAATAAAETPVQAPRPAPASASRVGPTPDRAPAPAPVRRDVYAPPASSATGMPTWLLAGLGILAALAVVVLIWRSTATTAAPDSSHRRNDRGPAAHGDTITGGRASDARACGPSARAIRAPASAGPDSVARCPDAAACGSPGCASTRSVTGAGRSATARFAGGRHDRRGGARCPAVPAAHAVGRVDLCPTRESASIRPLLLPDPTGGAGDAPGGASLVSRRSAGAVGAADHPRLRRVRVSYLQPPDGA